MSRVQSQPGAPFPPASHCSRPAGGCTCRARPAWFCYWGLACQSRDLEQRVVGGGRQREDKGGGRWGEGERKFHSLAHSHQIRERGTHTTSPFQELLCPCFCFGSFPSGLGMARLVGWAGADAQVPGQLGSRPAPSWAWQAPPAITRHALLLVREASPSCFQSFITVLFVVQQIKFFWRLEGGDGGVEGERGGRRARERKYKQPSLGPKD